MNQKKKKNWSFTTDSVASTDILIEVLISKTVSGT